MNDTSPPNPSKVITGSDPDRPPKLNEDCINIGFPNHDPSHGSAERGQPVAPQTPLINSEDDDDVTSTTSSNVSSEQPISSDEGPEDHLIRVGEAGYLPFKTIFEALARHDRCTCHHGFGILADDYDYSFTTLPSGAPTRQGSMVVEIGSEEHSLASSLLNLQSRNSSVLALAGGWTTHHDAFGAGPAMGVYILNPLRLTPDLAYPLDLSISEGNSLHEEEC